MFLRLLCKFEQQYSVAMLLRWNEALNRDLNHFQSYSENHHTGSVKLVSANGASHPKGNYVLCSALDHCQHLSKFPSSLTPNQSERC